MILVRCGFCQLLCLVYADGKALTIPALQLTALSALARGFRSRRLSLVFDVVLIPGVVVVVVVRGAIISKGSIVGRSGRGHVAAEILRHCAVLCSVASGDRSARENAMRLTVVVVGLSPLSFDPGGWGQTGYLGEAIPDMSKDRGSFYA